MRVDCMCVAKGVLVYLGFCCTVRLLYVFCLVLLMLTFRLYVKNAKPLICEYLLGFKMFSQILVFWYSFDILVFCACVLMSYQPFFSWQYILLYASQAISKEQHSCFAALCLVDRLQHQHRDIKSVALILLSKWGVSAYRKIGQGGYIYFYLIYSTGKTSRK